MRLTLAQAAANFRVAQSLLEDAAARGNVRFDSDGTTDVLMAQSIARYVSNEFSTLFGGATLPAHEIVYSRRNDSAGEGLVPAGIDLVGAHNLGLVTGGRQFFQVPSLDVLRATGADITSEMTNCCFLIRDEDTSSLQALADAYMLGDARVQQAVRVHMTSDLQAAV